MQSLASLRCKTCRYSEFDYDPNEIRLSSTHPFQTKVTDTNFELNDNIGVYMIVKGAALQFNGNELNNEENEGDFPDDTKVYIHNTVTTASINLSTGDIGKDTYASAQSIKAKDNNFSIYSLHYSSEYHFTCPIGRCCYGKYLLFEGGNNLAKPRTDPDRDWRKHE